MIVGVCGFTYTGSGAYKDLLKEYEEIELLTDDDFEFTYVYRTDGILDLKHHLVDCIRKDIDGDFAVKRFVDCIKSDIGVKSRIQKLTQGQYQKLSYEYIESLTAVSWSFRRLREYQSGGLKGLYGRLLFRIQRVLDKKLDHYVAVFPEVKYRICNNPENFTGKSKHYIMSIIDAMRGTDRQILLIDQPFPADHPECCFPFFDDPYAIIVDRDPRDLFLMFKKVCFARGKLTDNVEDFIIYYKKMREGIEKESSDRVLRVSFEDLVYNYDETVEKVEHFLHITNHVYPKRYFNPEVSIRNTQLLRKYPEELKNIQIIEHELSGYLYPFDETISIDSRKNSF